MLLLDAAAESGALSYPGTPAFQHVARTSGRGVFGLGMLQVSIPVLLLRAGASPIYLSRACMHNLLQPLPRGNCNAFSVEVVHLNASSGACDAGCACTRDGLGEAIGWSLTE